MSIEFRDVSLGPLSGLSVAAPSHSIIGLIGEKGCGITEILQLAAGDQTPASGAVLGPEHRRYTGPQDPVSPSPVELLALDHALAKYDAVVRARTIAGLERLRRAGATILLASHEETLLERLCDELWWIQEGRLVTKGQASEVLKRYRTYVANRIEAWGATLKPRLEPIQRFGTHAAEIDSIELLDCHGASALACKSGAEIKARITLRFLETVAEPVIGIIIRTRIGLEAYRVDSRVDGLRLGPCAIDQIIKVTFQFRCEMGAGDYTLTAAAQDVEGTVHDWLDDAVGFVVVDDRPSTGFVNLHGRVSVEP